MKKSTKTIAALLAVVMITALFAVIPFAASDSLVLLPGDANADGSVNASDYISVRLHILTIKSLTGASLDAADYHKDGSVDIKDYIALRRHLLGIIQEAAPIKVAYIPIDDRPVNVDRVVYLAESAGFELLMPEHDAYATKLDNQPLNSNGSQTGNREELFDWLKSLESHVDYYVISLDQLLSGGLVGSRWYANNDLSFEYEIIDYLVSLACRKQVYFFDTVTRLASTVGFDGYGYDEYAKLREYGAHPRPVLEAGELTVNSIADNYAASLYGGTVNSSLPESAISLYLAVRERKLRLADRFLSLVASAEKTYTFIGVDDSSPQNTIQTNEIAYINSKLKNGTLFAGTDELGMMAFTKLCSDYYSVFPSVKVNYFGGGENQAADGFDIGTLKSCLELHLDSLGCKAVQSGEGDISLLVLTRPVSGSAIQNAQALYAKMTENLKNGVPTAVLDCSGRAGELASKLLEEDDLGLLLGYSSWNTVGNTVGIAVSQAVSRYIYISRAEDTEMSKKGFVKSLAFALCKDIGYKLQKAGESGSYVSGFGSASNFYPQLGGAYTEEAVNRALGNIMYSGSTHAKRLTDKLSGSLMLTKGGAMPVGKVSLSDFYFPWYRTFEISFKINN